MSLNQAETAYYKATNCAIQEALMQLTVPGEYLHQLLDGRAKVLLIEWNGSRDDSNPVCSAARGDGLVHLCRPGDPGYDLPPHVHPGEPSCNIRAGVPFWLLSRPGANPRATVHAIGKVHPLLNSASYALYSKRSYGQSRLLGGNRKIGIIQLLHVYQPDWRSTNGDVELFGTSLDCDTQQVLLEQMGGAMQAAPFFCPVYSGIMPTQP